MDDFTTKRCCHCGQVRPLTEFNKNRSTHDGLSKWCRVCIRAHFDDPAHRATRMAASHRRYMEKRDSILAKEREQRRVAAASRPPKPVCDDPRARKRENDRAYRQRPDIRERKRQRMNDRYHNDPGFRQRMKESRLRYERENPDSKIVARRKSHNRRVKIRGAGGSFTNEDWIALCERYDHCCLCCGEQKSLTIDHIVAIGRGGTNDITNIQPLCFGCNRRKGTQTIDYRR